MKFFKIILYGFILVFLFIIIYFIKDILTSPPGCYKEYFTSPPRLCCLYSYYEKDDKYKEHFTFFLNNGILNHVDYYIIINGDCSIDVPTRENIKVMYRENKGFDFGSYSYAIKKLDKEYDYYFFLNTSIRGPYLKTNEDKDWTKKFLCLFNPNVKLVGTSINIFMNDYFLDYNLSEIYGHNKPFSHVQSMFFCLDNEYLKYLIQQNFFDEDEMNNNNNKEYVIAYKEFGLSQILLNQKYNINCILSKYKDIDYLNVHSDFNPTSLDGDPYFNNCYFGESIDPYEVIFYKNNR